MAWTGVHGSPARRCWWGVQALAWWGRSLLRSQAVGVAALASVGHLQRAPSGRVVVQHPAPGQGNEMHSPT